MKLLEDSGRGRMSGSQLVQQVFLAYHEKTNVSLAHGRKGFSQDLEKAGDFLIRMKLVKLVQVEEYSVESMRGLPAYVLNDAG